MVKNKLNVSKLNVIIFGALSEKFREDDVIIRLQPITRLADCRTSTICYQGCSK